MRTTFTLPDGVHPFSPAGLAGEGRPVKPSRTGWLHCFSTLAAALLLCGMSVAQSTGNAGSITGTVTDSTGAVVPNATVTIENPVSEYSRTAATDDAGRFNFPNVPLNRYHVTVTAKGFSNYVQDAEVRSSVAVSLKVNLEIGVSAENITVQAEAGDLLENDPTFHTDVDRSLFDKLPLESSSSEISSLVTLATPGVAADSTASSTAWGTMPQTLFPWTASPSPISKARSSPTRFRSMPCSRWKSSPVRHPPSTETKPAW